MELQLETTTKGVSVPMIIRSIKSPGLKNGKNFPGRQENYLRRTCANDFKKDFPLRKYSVKRFSDEGYVRVYWKYRKD